MTSDLSGLCLLLQEEQARRKAMIRSAVACSNAAEALTRRALGWRFGAPDAAEKKTRAHRIVAAIFAGKPVDPDDADVAAMIGPDLAAFAASYAPLELRRAEIKKEMERRAAALPVAPWAAAIRGFGPTGLAVTIGETGDLTNYPHWRMVWKRLGLMPVDGVACSRLKGRDLTAEQWTAVGYNPLRRAEIFACVGQSMAKHQWTAGAKSGTEFGLPTGPYGAVYVARREKTKADHPDWTKAHAYMDALRIMTKALISDLWSEWRRQHTDSLTSGTNIAGDASPFSSPGAGPERESPGAAP